MVVGSGASGVHFALTVLKKGYEVVMVDVGSVRPAPVDAQRSFNELKSSLSDPARYFLGQDYEGVVWPRVHHEYYGFPASKHYVFSRPPGFEVEATGFQPLFSFAQGGLAEVWTGGVYPLNERELEDFPFGYADIEPYYNEVARRIGITGVKDDLSRFFPFHDHLQEPLRLDQHSEQLLAAYEWNKEYFNSRIGCYMGRSRVAALSVDRGGRKACTYLGRCLAGCPTGALYTPSMTLQECLEHPNFTYLPGQFVSHLRFGADGRIAGAVAEPVAGGPAQEVTADQFILAAGTLCSSQIYLASILEHTGEIVELPGLMDNRQVLVPFVNLKMIGKRYNPDSYQYHQLALGIEGETPKSYVHGQITTLKTGLVHPIIHSLPLDLATSLSVFRNVRAALGVVNVNFPDRRRAENVVTLASAKRGGRPRLAIRYVPASTERDGLTRAVKAVRKALWKLGCVVPPGMTHVRPMGASVHYSGTLPMSRDGGSHTVSRHCRSHAIENLYVVDGTTFPFLPAKNLTFTLMANAVRVADQAF